MPTLPLSDIAIRNAKPKPKPYKVSDGGGLHLLVTPSGGKLWRLAYRHGGKQKQLALGQYPTIGLALARQKRTEAKALLAQGQDPAAAKKAAALASESENANTFGVVASKYLAKIESEGRAASTLSKTRWLLTDLASDLSDKPIAALTAIDVLTVLRNVEKAGHHESARRLRSAIGRVFRYAVACGLADRDPTTDLKDALTTPKVRHRAAITDARTFAKLLQAIWTWDRGQPTTVAALKLTALLALRPGEVRAATWSEIDLENAVWTVPAERAKMRRPHRTPLSRQAAEVLHALRPLTYRGPDSLVFPAITGRDKPLSENTMNVALRRLGFGPDQMTSHGFRATFSTFANESRMWHPDAIERQLAHVEANEVRRAYARGDHWDERVRMMQWWADYMDELRGGSVVPFLRKTA